MGMGIVNFLFVRWKSKIWFFDSFSFGILKIFEISWWFQAFHQIIPKNKLLRICMACINRDFFANLQYFSKILYLHYFTELSIHRSWWSIIILILELSKSHSFWLGCFTDFTIKTLWIIIFWLKKCLSSSVVVYIIINYQLVDSLL